MTGCNDIENRVLELATQLDDQGIIGLLGAMRGVLLERGVEPGCGRARDPRPSRMFFVPDGVRYLDGLQLAALAKAINDWTQAARTPQIHLSRQRLRLVFLMLRHSGAKVGEVLALNDTRDLDFDASEVIIRGETDQDTERRVILPRHFMQEIANFLESPAALSLRGRVFHLDQGFVRRKISEQADRAPIPRELLNPTVLRHSRAVELLRQGVPLPVVQRLLGHASVVLTSGYYAFSEDDSKRILTHYIQKESVLKTSARNTFLGTVTGMRAGELLTEVVIETSSGNEIVSVITNDSATNLGLYEGKRLAAIVKAPFVLVSKEEGATVMSARNRFPATVNKIHGDSISVEVTGTLKDGTTMCALITDESVGKLDLKTGDNVWFFFKAMSVILISE